MPNQDEPNNVVTPSLKPSITTLLQTISEIVQDTCRLAKLEARLASQSLLLIVGLGIGIVFLLLTAWLLGLAAWAAWLVSNGWHWVNALLVMVLLNFLLALCLVALILKYKQNLAFQATRRQLQNNVNARVQS